MMEVRKLPVKVETLQLNGDYTGWEFTARTNPPWGEFMGRLTAIEKVDQLNPEKVLEGLYDLLELVMQNGKWNYVDDKGKPITCDRAGFPKLPLELIQLTLSAAREAIEKVPLAPSAG